MWKRWLRMKMVGVLIHGHVGLKKKKEVVIGDVVTLVNM